jgi:Predicted acyltransferases
VNSTLSIKGRASSTHLDIIRGAAAIAVLIYHVRYRFFLDYSQIENPSLMSKAYYAVTSYGHDAVIVFFVLSGYFISSSIHNSLAQNRWSWGHYFSNRLVRLYVVLIPALILTLFWDICGSSWFGAHPVYSGESLGWQSDYYPVLTRLNVTVLAGNALFLQTVYCPPLGSNDALWSLAYEFWYYLLFPAIAVAIYPSTTSASRRLAAGAVACCVLLIISRSMLLYFPVWLLGWAAGQVGRHSWVTRHAKGLSLFVLAIFAAMVTASHLGLFKSALNNSVLLIDYVNGMAFAVLLWILLHDVRLESGNWYSFLGSTMSGMSYSLYALHLPLLVFLRAAFTAPRPWELNAMTLTAAAAISLACLIYAWLLANVTEAKTAQIKSWLGSLLPTSTIAPPAPAGAGEQVPLLEKQGPLLVDSAPMRP